MQQKYIHGVEVLCFCYVHLEPHANVQVTILHSCVYIIFHCMTNHALRLSIYLEFNTLHGTRIYAHSSAKAYFESCHSDYAIF